MQEVQVPLQRLFLAGRHLRQQAVTLVLAQDKDLDLCRIGLADCSLHQLHAGQCVCVALQSLAQLRHRLHGDAAHVVAAPLAAGLQKPVDSQTPVFPRASEVLYERGVRAKANLHKLHHLAAEVAPSRRGHAVSQQCLPAELRQTLRLELWGCHCDWPPPAHDQALPPEEPPLPQELSLSAPSGLSQYHRHPQLAWLQPNNAGSRKVLNSKMQMRYKVLNALIAEIALIEKKRGSRKVHNSIIKFQWVSHRFHIGFT